MRILVGLVTALALALVAAPAHAERRIALLVGNKAYTEEIGPLANPYNDVEAVRDGLIASGFSDADIRIVRDATRTELLSAVDAFAARARDLTGEDIAFFYYSGHGAARPGRDGVNLIPVDADGVDQADFWYDTVDFDDVIETFQGAHSDAAWILAVDACRNELRLPVRDIGGDGDKGFGVVPTAAGMLIAFAADSRQTARDRVSGSRVSPFAKALSEELSGPARAASAVFSSVRPKVIAATGGAQEPVSTLRLNRDPLLGRAGVAAAVAPDASVRAEDLNRIADLEARLDSLTSANEGAVQVYSREPAGGWMRGDVFKECDACPTMVVVPGGVFTMGSPEDENGRHDDEGPQRTLEIVSFAVAKFELTWDEWSRCLADGACSGYEPPDHGWGRRTIPISSVSWDDAQAYVSWLNSKLDGAPYRLLTEAEWEYAARAGSAEPYSWGDEFPVCDETAQNGANFYGCPQDGPMMVNSFAPNRFGLHNMHGNVAEWVEDCYSRDYQVLNVYGITGADAFLECAAAGGPRVLRGGGFDSYRSFVRSANRMSLASSLRPSVAGIRLARSLD